MQIDAGWVSKDGGRCSDSRRHLQPLTRPCLHPHLLLQRYSHQPPRTPAHSHARHTHTADTTYATHTPHTHTTRTHHAHTPRTHTTHTHHTHAPHTRTTYTHHTHAPHTHTPHTYTTLTHLCHTPCSTYTCRHRIGPAKGSERAPLVGYTWYWAGYTWL